MASSTVVINNDKDSLELQNEENRLNISLESDHLDPEQKAAHEADTLPMDAPQVSQTKQQNKLSSMLGQYKDYLSPMLVKAGYLYYY